MSAKHPILNLINGNIADAKKRAKLFSYSELLDAAQNVLGLERRVAALHAGYLKGRCSWETYCAGVAPATLERGLAYTLRSLQTEEQAARCDPAAVFGIAQSLYAYGCKHHEGEMSEAYNGTDQFYREIMNVADAFERWSNLRVDFAENAEVWPYFLQDNFADALEAASPGAILALAKLTVADFVKIAAQLKLTLLS